MKKIVFALQILTFLLFTSCSPQPKIPNTSKQVIDHIVISEVLSGKHGNNPYDFIELHNPTEEIVDLKGYSLWYQLKDGDEESLLYIWDTSALIPPKGHYLLGQEGQGFGIMSDSTFRQSLVPSSGGLLLKNPKGDITDSLGWGKTAPLLATEGEPAQAMDIGISLERLPSNLQGNGTDSDNNSQDFILNNSPNPQNTGSTITPNGDGEINFSIVSPASVPPGENFDLTLQLENATGILLEGVTVNFQLPRELSVIKLGQNVSIKDNQILWEIGSLGKSNILTSTISVTSPWTYSDIMIHNNYVTASNRPLATFAQPGMIKIEGGSIPIATARELLNTEVVIEGIATMYVGGFYSGSGAKFYLADETGGAQVYVAGAGSTLRVNIGDRVRVQGIVTIYRDSIEIVPASEGSVEILETNSNIVEPIQATIKEVTNDRIDFPGSLVQVKGTLARVEEFSYSYEIDIVDADGQLLTLYVDKLTEINIDDIQSGYQFSITGIVELLDNNLRLYPRTQNDFQRIYPEILLTEVISEISVNPDEEFDITVYIYNHTKNTVSDINVILPIPEGFNVFEINDRGINNGTEIIWNIDEVEGGGNHKTVSISGKIEENTEYIVIKNYSVVAPGFKESFIGDPTYTFAGGAVPIWAIQGSGFRSPYTNRYLETQGIITAVFPELEGFWIQEITTDNDPKTSAGLFIYTKDFQTNLSPGDLISVSGIIQEYFQQTEIVVGSPNNIRLISSGNNLPIPSELNPPENQEAAFEYYESLEGTFVSVTEESTVVAPTNRYGEFAFVLSRHNRERLFQGEENGIIIMGDDGSSQTHNEQSTLDYVVAVGDKINSIAGPLAFSFGQFKIEPISQPEIIRYEPEYTAVKPLTDNEFSIMTWNVENLFDILDPHPSSPPLPKVSEYRQQIAKVAQTIFASGTPTIVGLQEVENLGVLEDITQQDLIKQFNYIPILIEGTDSRGIDVGYLIRGDQAKILLEEQHPAPGGITSRPPLLVKVQLLGSDTSLYVLNNHFTSMSGGEAATEPRRIAQAEWNVNIMQDILQGDSTAKIAIIGDLNSYYRSPPIETLREAGLIHVFEKIPAEERYTYIFQGISQAIDHILVTPSLEELISEVVVLRTNSDFPISAPDDVSPLHKSDHDPVIVKFIIP